MEKILKFRISNVFAFIFSFMLISLICLSTYTNSSAYHGREIFLTLDYAHFLPLTDPSLHQVKVISNFTVLDSAVENVPINAVLQIFLSNGTLIKRSSYPDPIIANSSGQITLATTLTDGTINNITGVVMITNSGKTAPLSNSLTIKLNYPQEISE